MVDRWRVGRRVVAGIVILVGVLAVVAMLAAPGVGTGSATPTLTVEERARLEGGGRATLAVRALTCDGWIRGSAFVTDGWIVTALHVVDGSVGVEILAEGGAPAAGVASRHAAGLDAAAVIPNFPMGPELVLADADPPVGAPVVAFGRVDGAARRSEGTVQLYGDGRAYGVDGTVMLIDPGAPFGFSGGPVLDRRGRVVAMTRAIDTATGLGVAIPASELEAWLSSPLNEDQYTSCIEE
ncbi:MAG: serine protease [Acidimicrobiales bacterium]